MQLRLWWSNVPVCIGYVPVAAIKPSWPRQFIKEGVYLGLWFQGNKNSWWQRCGVWRQRPTASFLNCKQEAERASSTWHNACRGMLSSVRPGVPSLCKWQHQLGTKYSNAQDYLGTSHSNQHSVQPMRHIQRTLLCLSQIFSCWSKNTKAYNTLASFLDIRRQLVIARSSKSHDHKK